MVLTTLFGDIFSNVVKTVKVLFHCKIMNFIKSCAVMFSFYCFIFKKQNTPILPKHPMIPPFTSSPFLPAVTMVTSPMVSMPPIPTSQAHMLLSPPHSAPSNTLLSQHNSLNVAAMGSCGNGSHVSSGGSSGGGGSGGGGGGGSGPIRRRVSDKCNLPISTGTVF